MNLAEYLDDCHQRVNDALKQYLPTSQLNIPLHAAMHYVVFNGGKRLRPALVYAAGNAVGVPPTHLDAPASAVELTHTYSLVHDDLPAMDNDDLRRGKPTCHKAFDEATAILAGDALQTLAFEILATRENSYLNCEQRLEMIKTLAKASGFLGMAGGQSLDLAATGKTLMLAELETIHAHKTGALIRASIRMGALAAHNIPSDTLLQLDEYASCIGLAFQIQDDILDVEGNTAALGKHTGSDAAHRKTTYPAIVGMHAAKQKLQELHQQALHALKDFDTKAEFLRALSSYIIQREY